MKNRILNTTLCILVSSILIATTSASFCIDGRLHKRCFMESNNALAFNKASISTHRLLTVKDYSEDSRKFRRKVFTHKDWIKHRSSNRTVKNLTTLLKSGIVRQTLTECLITIFITICVYCYNLFFIYGFEDLSMVHHNPLVSTSLPPAVLPSVPFNFASPALGLLLVFKTNTSYARWDDSRKAWGLIVNHTRDMVRMTAAKATPQDEENLRIFALYTWVFPRALTYHLLGDEDKQDFEEDMREKLPSDIAEEMIGVRHKPIKALSNLSNQLTKLTLSDIAMGNIENSITELCNASGTCERIFSSPVPLVYTRHTSRFVAVWVLLLPFALWEPFGDGWNHIGMIPASIILSFFFFGIDELSVQLEEPFSVLPLHSITRGIEAASDEHVQWYDSKMKKEDQHPNL